MNYKEAGFRKLYHHFCAFPLTDAVIGSLKDFPNIDKANGYLAYGYIDHEAGFTLEVLSAVKVSDNDIEYFSPSKDVRSIVRIGAVEEEPFILIEDKDHALEDQYADRIRLINENYFVNDNVEKTREMAFLDECRDSQYIDDVLVYLTKDGNQPEGVWARISNLGDYWIMGIMLNEPSQDFGWHQGENFAFFTKETEDHKVICWTDMNPSQKVTAEDLEDGSMLEAAIHKYNSERNMNNFLDVMEILRDSCVWVPCKDDTDLKHFETELLTNDSGTYFPIFSTKEAAGDFYKNYVKTQKHILNVMKMIQTNQDGLDGIVINAFDEYFILEKKGFDILVNMKFRVELNDENKVA